MTQNSTTRVAYSPGEFAALFGKSQTWGYRQIYAGKVNAITEHGRILIPAKEVERVLESAGIYNGREQPKQAKVRAEKLTQEQKSIWQRFVESQRKQPVETDKARRAQSPNPHSPVPTKGNSKSAVLGKIAASWGAKKRRD